LLRIFIRNYFLYIVFSKTRLSYWIMESNNCSMSRWF
jgi:hypothetical protein